MENKLERLRTTNTDVVWEKSIADLMSRRLADKAGKLVKENDDLSFQLGEIRRHWLKCV